MRGGVVRFDGWYWWDGWLIGGWIKYEEERDRATS